VEYADIPKRNQEIARLGLQGFTAKELARVYQLGHPYVEKILDKAEELRLAGAEDPTDVGLIGKYTSRKIRVHYRAGTPAAKKRLASMTKMYDKGVSLDEIGARHGVSRERVRQLMKTTGRTVRQPKPSPQPGEQQEASDPDMLRPC
jgi:Sigma-70, region 4